jgi:hypothetical protein
VPFENGSELIKYAALDALLSRKIAEKLVDLLLRRPDGMLETPAGLKVGQNVDLFLSGKIVALRIMEFIGIAGCWEK